MAGVDAYVSQVNTSPSVRPVSIPDLPGGSVIGGALAGLGEQASQLAKVVRAGAEEANAANASTEYQQGIFDLQKKYQQDPDYQTAPARFAEDRMALEKEILGRGFTAPTQARLENSFRTHGLVAQGELDNHALTRLGDDTAANLDRQESLYFTRLRQAQTPVQRQAVIADWNQSLAAPTATGLISEQNMVARQQRRDALIDQADLLSMTEKNPAAAVAALDDPKQFPNLSPVERERYRSVAAGSASDMSADQLVNGSRFNPAIASLELGHVVDPSHLDTIFQKGMIPQESGGDPNAVSPKGALGVAQLIPPTAREMASDLGMVDVAKLSDADLKAKLLSDSGLNATLGRAYLSKMAIRYDGSVPLALAAYNAGPERADRWQKEAEAQFGAGYSPAQLVSVIDIAETKDYVTKIYGRMGARLDPGILPTAIFATTNKVGEIISADQRQRDQVTRDLAAVGRSSDATIESLKQGLPIAGEAYMAELQTQQAAAATGSPEAASRVRELTEAWANAPLVREAYAMPPAALEAAIGGERARLAKLGNTSGEDFRRLKNYEAVSKEITDQAGKDPLGLADRARIVGVQPFDPAADFSRRATIAALQVRDFQAGLAEKTYRGALLPFRPEEAAALKARFDQAELPDKLAMLDGLGKGLGPEAYRAALGQIADPDSGLAYAADIAHSAGDDENLTLLMQQYALERDKDYKPPTLAPTVTAPRVAQVYGTAMLALPSRQAALAGNADKIFLALARQRGIEPDPAKQSGLYDEALQRAAGMTTGTSGEQLGGIADVNGFPTLAPAGFPADRVEQVLHGLSDAQLKALPKIASANSLPVTADQLQDAELLAVGDGIYRVRVGQRFAMAENGGFWTLDIKQLANLTGSGRPTREAPIGRGGR